MIWQPTSSAWKMLRSSRGLAHSNSALGRFASASRHSRMCGIGSIPVSAMRPANTETIAGVSRLSVSATSATCAMVMTAVTLSKIPSRDIRRMTGPVNWPLVVTTGILTYTFRPQAAMTRPCCSIPSKSSANTLILSSSIIIGLAHLGSGQDPRRSLGERFYDLIGTIWRLFRGIAEVDEYRPASRSCPRLDIAAAIPYHEASGKIDAQFACGCEKHPGSRLAAGATVLLGVKTSLDGIHRHPLREAPVHLLHDVPTDAAGAHVGLVGDHDEREPRLLQPLQARRSIGITPTFIQTERRETAA